MTDARSCAVLLAVQRALLGAVTPRLRAVTVDHDATKIALEAYYDGPITDDDRETMSTVETEILAEFPDTHIVTLSALRLDAPTPIPKHRTWAYYRKER